MWWRNPGVVQVQEFKEQCSACGAKLDGLCTGPFDLSHIDILLTCSAVSSDVPVHGRLAVAWNIALSGIGNCGQWRVWSPARSERASCRCLTLLLEKENSHAVWICTRLLVYKVWLYMYLGTFYELGLSVKRSRQKVACFTERWSEKRDSICF